MDNLCKRCYHNYVCEQYNENRDLTRTKCDYKNSHFIDAADVAPVRHGRWECGKPCPIGGRDRFDGLDADIWADWEPPYCPNCGCRMDLEG